MLSKRENGFTVLELIITLAVSLVVLGAVVSTFVIQNKHYHEQDQVVDMQENARGGMQMMVNDLMMAGYNPAAIASVGIVSADSSSIQFTADLNGDGDVDDTNENVTYAYDDTNDQLTRKSTAADTATPLSENIDSLTFTYYDNSGAVTSSPSSIRKIEIEMTAKTKDGDRIKTLESDVKPRNLALSAPPATGSTVTETSTTTVPEETTTVAEETTTVAEESTTVAEESTTVAEETTTVAEETTTTDSSPDTTGPTADMIVQTPSGDEIANNIDVEVCAEITDPAGIDSVVLDTTYDGHSSTITMTNTSGDTYCGTIPKHNNSTVTYSITSTDNLGNPESSAEYGYTQA